MADVRFLTDRVKLEGRRAFTFSIWGDVPVYGERYYETEGGTWREWNPSRSKLAAYLLKGGTIFPFAERNSVLYLGVAQGTTASHISDICVGGQIYGVEISPEAIRKFTALSTVRRNLYPILADAARPESYADLLPPKVEIIYQDIAQKNQVDILLKNSSLFLKKDGLAYLMLKARSVDVTAPAARIYSEVRRRLLDVFEILDERSLKPYSIGHRAFVLRRL